MPRLAFVLLCFLLAGCGPARAQQDVTVFPGLRGVTVCLDGFGALSWTQSGMSEGERGEVEVHEEAHRVHMSEFPDCGAWRDWWQGGVRNWVEAEARAFCASSKYAAKRDAIPLEAAIYRSAIALSDYYPFGLSLPEAAAAIRKACAVP